ncbi:MAG TPA: adenylate/guanylate cyclase domain-containing protein [Chthoniobacterales bacterium]
MTTTPQAWLETIKGERIPLTGACSIGRDAQNALVVTGDKVSRRHALIHSQNENELWLVDLGSRNGTFRNSRPIKQPTQLRDGDTITIGAVQFTLRMERPSTAAAASTLGETMVSKRTTEVWLLVTDVENFTVMSQSLAPEELTRRLGAWLRECSDFVEKTGGCVDKYVGDGFLAYWEAKGKPGAFAETLKKLTQLQEKASLPFRWVLHHAHLQLGASRFGNDSLVGKEINFSYRMEKIAGGLNLPRMLSRPAREALGENFKARSVGVQPIKGFEGTFEFFAV